MGIDFGSKRVGVALSDPEGSFSLPFGVFENNKDLIVKILDVCATNDVGEIVVGESKDYKGKNNPIMKKILAFKQELEQRGRKVVFHPEFLTSAEAKRLQGKGEMLDASAAALILKSYMDRHRS
jgi:putative holliday junction resolvase